MQRKIEEFQENVFDLIIIGGGITGSCLAHDAALRGLTVALVEKNDFGSCTSSASSKLLHGGIRYLQKVQFKKVRESCRERAVFQRIAPHLTCCVPFLIPTVNDSVLRGKMAMRAGMFVYNLLCRDLDKNIADPAKQVPRGKFCSRDEILHQVPLLKSINGLNGAQVLYESHMNSSERMTLAFVKTAVSNGAKVANYSPVTGFLQEGDRIVGVFCKDLLTGVDFEIHGKVVVNAAGPFIPEINRSVDKLKLHRQTTGFSKGIHLVTRQITDHYALALTSEKKTEGFVVRGGRHFFIIPWRGRSLIGTTNVPFDGAPENVSVTKDDIVDFINDINSSLPGANLKELDVYYAFAGIYPLFSERLKSDTYQGTGEYQVVDHFENDGVHGAISVFGAKYTTARAVAELGVDLVLKKLGFSARECTTGFSPLSEGRIPDFKLFINQKERQYKSILGVHAVRSLVSSYGSEVDSMVKYLLQDHSYMERLDPDFETLVGEVDFAVQEEMACTLSDVIFRRTGLGTVGHPGESVVLKTAEIMANRLNWGKQHVRNEIDRVNKKYHFADV